MLIMVVVYIGCTVWTDLDFVHQLADAAQLNFVGLRQYAALFGNERWLISVENLAIFGVPVHARQPRARLPAGRADRPEDPLRGHSSARSSSIPFALSFIVTGLVWQWMLNPTLRHRRRWCATSAWTSFTFDWLVRQDIVIYSSSSPRLWQGTGLVMAMMLAGLRGIDEEIWKAARVDGIPTWRTYLFIVIPMMRPVLRHRARPARDRHRAALRPRRRA